MEQSILENGEKVIKMVRRIKKIAKKYLRIWIEGKLELIAKKQSVSTFLVPHPSFNALDNI